MTKQQLREVIRHLIKKELLNEALLLHPVQAAYMRGYEDGEQGKPANLQSVEDLQLYENQPKPATKPNEPITLPTTKPKIRPTAPGKPSKPGNVPDDEPAKARNLKKENESARAKIINRLKNKM
jgi:outer membrane biosynthesis protein TonB